MKTYFVNKGTYQDKYDLLVKAINDNEGNVTKPGINKAFEKFRIANKCYIGYHSGDYKDRARDFYQLFKRSCKLFKTPSGKYSPSLYRLMERVMHTLIIDAWDEQSHPTVEKKIPDNCVLISYRDASNKSMSSPLYQHSSNQDGKMDAAKDLASLKLKRKAKFIKMVSADYLFE